MLRKIPTQQLRVGMHIHEVCGSWFAHSFWRSSFRLNDARQLAELRAVSHVVIDTAKGLDIEAAVAPTTLMDDVEVGSAEVPETSLGGLEDAPAPDAACSFEQEVVRASRLIAQSRQAMQTMFQDVRLGKAVDAENCLPLVADIEASVARNPGAIVSLARLKSSDDYTYMHSVAVCALMVALSRQLGLSAADTREAGLAGLVHDLGKARMPLDVLNKPGALTPEEFTIMKGHPQAGHTMLVEGRGVGPIPLDVCLHHHEKVNGKGYPHGLKGEEISLFARMGAVCDVYDAITSNRPYKAGWDPAESLSRMAKWTGGHFDPRVFQAFVRSLGIYPVGSLVKLNNERLAVVVDQSPRSLLKPIVKVFYSLRHQERLPPQEVDLSAPHTKLQILGREDPADWTFPDLNDIWSGGAAPHG